MISFDDVNQQCDKENTVATESHLLTGKAVQNDDFSEYVAHLQLHMTLQARNLVPTFKHSVEDSRQQLLHQTQANFEKLISRQGL
ncbi:hypothetical protein H6G80_28825 [Nostoc sp. FACHB-87]|uniref:hypothetical protein n=1 Tax=Nostocales TaxID=1161 RepID=UPI00168430C5|nr:MULTISPECIES: hypothetical protein [Nostocales]MBD2303140.1 hypothetical protein [Nostoc sp. FACHB-190]MBD2458056.1 hypothetical protein [Nostoc sp. FACHB-87]MBD2479288.1 hypothetical protein [Anabaena sp. FACHB-83]MBD2492506.1 hypothetical protein [Aulosira sp. FACHB-615]